MGGRRQRRRERDGAAGPTHGLGEEGEEVVREMEVLETDEGGEAEREKHELVLRDLHKLQVVERPDLLRTRQTETVCIQMV